MEGVLRSETIRTLFNQLTVSLSLQELQDRTRICLAPLAKEYGFGKMELLLEAPTSGFSPKGESMYMLLYEDDTQKLSKSGKEDLFTTPENGGVKVVSYPVEGKVWSKEENGDLSFLAQLLYMIYGRQRMGSLLHYYSTTDILTGVTNVNGMNQHVGKLSALGRISQYSGFLVNIKNFRYINQVAGEKGGDEFLRKFAQEMSQQLVADEIIVRIGGDNFLMIIRDINMGELMAFLESLEIGLTVNGEEMFFKVPTRAGIYSMREGDTASDIMTKTNMALQLSRMPGQREWIRFTPSMIAKMNHDKDVVQAFSQAILAREFQPYFQPKVDLKTGKMIGCEALARWIVNGKMIPPMEFVPSLEQDGSICQLDFYILERVCRTLRRWIDLGIKPVPVAVNFSRMHFHNRSVGYDILDILERFDIDPELIEIEVTEMYGYENYENMLDFTNFLKSAGIHVSVDDFGTGYSSLSLVSNLNADSIKVDKSFLDKMRLGRNEDKLLVRHIVSMIRDLNFSAIAEGVETTDQVLQLKEMGCFIGQGYLFDKPLPTEEFEKRLQDEDVYRKLVG